MHTEFARLAVARRIANARSSGLSPACERSNAERWITQFGAGAGDQAPGTTVTRGERRLIVTPARNDPDAPRVLYIHGGGMVFYSASLFGVPLSILASSMQCVVEAFEYQKAPECDPEVSIRDLAERVVARCEDGDVGQAILAGDSVGALFALYLAVRALPGRFARLVLIYPVLEMRDERASYEAFGEGHFLDAAAMRRFRSFLQAPFARRDFDPFRLSEHELAGMPPCSLVTAGCDVLRDEGMAWAAHLAARGRPLHHRHFADLPHDFCLYSGKLVSARQAVESMAETSFNPQEAKTCI